MRSLPRVLRGNPWKGSSLLREEARGVQWSDSNSIAEAVTKARPGGTSSRADEWRTQSVRSDPKLGANDLVMARPRPTACLPVRNRTGTSARERESCEGRGCRTRKSMGRMRHTGGRAQEGPTCELPARNQVSLHALTVRCLTGSLPRQSFLPGLYSMGASRPDQNATGNSFGNLSTNTCHYSDRPASPQRWHAGGCL